MPASSLRLDTAAKVIMALYLCTFALVAVFGNEPGGANVSWDLRKTHVTQLTVWNAGALRYLAHPRTFTCTWADLPM